MYTVELMGSHTAQCLDLDIKVTAEKHGIIDRLARKMIKEGADPQQTIRVIRSGIPVFAQDRTVEAWASERLLESDRKGFRRTPFVAWT